MLNYSKEKLRERNCHTCLSSDVQIHLGAKTIHLSGFLLEEYLFSCETRASVNIQDNESLVILNILEITPNQVGSQCQNAKMIKNLEETSWGAENNRICISRVFRLGAKGPVFVRRKKEHVQFTSFFFFQFIMVLHYRGKIYIT